MIKSDRFYNLNFGPFKQKGVVHNSLSYSHTTRTRTGATLMHGLCARWAGQLRDESTCVMD